MSTGGLQVGGAYRLSNAIPGFSLNNNVQTTGAKKKNVDPGDSVDVDI